MSIENTYDVVIVGAGITGAIVANQLAEKGHKVLILEAGVKKSFDFESYRSYLHHYYQNTIKIPNSPYPQNPNAPQPLVTDVGDIEDGIQQFSKDGYFKQYGPAPFQSTYTRAKGGTTLHWLGTCLRMLPSDFKEKDLYDSGKNWPINYYDLMPYYRMAEREIGVSADVDEQAFLGIEFEENYVYPMTKIPQSHLDKKLTEWTEGATFDYEGKKYPYKIVSTPQGRNSNPNPKYNNGEGYQPVGAVGNPDLGQRCEGNSACVPICPVQAKYNALKTLKKAVDKGVVIYSQCVASEILYDKDTGEITGIKYKEYEDFDSLTDANRSCSYKEKVIKAKRYVLAAHAVENAKLMLASGFKNKNIGQNLMDHPVLLTWGLAPEAIGAFRGPGSTSGIPSLRDGTFRRDRSAFRIEIGNWGWNWPTGSPTTELQEGLSKGLFGKELRTFLLDTVQKEFRLGFLIEQQALSNNSVTIDDRYRDELGNHRPIVNYNITDHEKEGMLAAKEFSKQFFDALGGTDKTKYSSDRGGFILYKDEELWWQGAGHLAGTHIMGTNKENSVVDKDQRCHEHKNLFLIGCGNMPTMGTSNPTLTIAALSFWAAENISKDLNSLKK
ncbi:GMC family oxidoreductase [uncultured Aquimarina sp.]|uniref:GMC family oxidoreductase n=1 Tax=uncultured Aquimarina sp. TaxID=575652 RepID=UPI002621132F|nr:GMC family oxidoreductase [uncultured Aquimarina sp.]